MLDKRLLLDPSINRLDRMMSRKRFLDDLWFIWRSTERAFENFKTALNNLGIRSCFTLKGEVGTTVEFLDVKMELIGGRAETSLFIKPTDSEQYLNRRSDHSTHVFSGIPYSQFRRAITICSREDDRAAAINYIYEKFANSGYRPQELDKCKDRALQLDREEILNQHRTVSRQKDDGILTFVINHDPRMVRTLKEFLKANEQVISQLIGDKRIVISERRGPNTASMLFAKSAFSQLVNPRGTDQRCRTGGCLTCGTMNLDRQP